MQGVLIGVLLQLLLKPLLFSSMMIGLCRSRARVPGVNDEEEEEEEEEEANGSIFEEIIAVEFCEVQDDMFMFSPFIIMFKGFR